MGAVPREVEADCHDCALFPMTVGARASSHIAGSNPASPHPTTKGMMMKMKLRSLRIVRESYWSEENEKLKGTLELASGKESNGKTALEIELTDDEVQKILAVCADSIVLAAKRHSQIILDEVEAA